MSSRCDFWGGNRPVIITEQALVAKLLPYIRGYPWALDTIGDLWRMGAPIPNSDFDCEHRILTPSRFRDWWADVCKHVGVGGRDA